MRRHLLPPNGAQTQRHPGDAEVHGYDQKPYAISVSVYRSKRVLLGYLSVRLPSPPLTGSVERLQYMYMIMPVNVSFQPVGPGHSPAEGTPASPVARRTPRTIARSTARVAIASSAR